MRCTISVSRVAPASLHFADCLSVENRIQNSRAEQEDALSDEQKALLAAAEKAGVDAKDVEKGRKEREEEEGKEGKGKK